MKKIAGQDVSSQSRADRNSKTQDNDNADDETEFMSRRKSTGSTSVRWSQVYYKGGIPKTLLNNKRSAISITSNKVP